MQEISKQTIERAQAGDQDAFSLLYQTTYSRNYYIALKMVKREAEAEDILQDAYVKIYHKLGQFTYTGENSFASWSSKIVSNTALDFLRKKSPILFSEMGDEEGDVVFDIEDTTIGNRPDLSLDQKETSRIVRELLDELSDEQRICILMYYIQELSIAEIAEQCACPEATVKSRLRYARIKLQGQGERLEREGIRLKRMTPLALLLFLLQKEAAKAAEAVPTLKPGGMLPEGIAENMAGHMGEGLTESMAESVKETVIQGAAKTVSKKIMVLLVIGGIVIGVAGSYTAQLLWDGNGQQYVNTIGTTTSSPSVTDMPAKMPEEKNGTTPKVLTEPSTKEPALKPTVEPTQKPTLEPTQKPTPKPTVKVTKKPEPKPTVKMTKKPEPKPTVKVTKKPEPKPTVKATKKPTPKPTKKPSDDMEWDDDYVDWDD